MDNHIIRKEDGTIMKWNKSNNYTFCLLYNDNKQKYNFTPTQDLKCSVFMIGGGGAGGYYFGGGGGAGAAYMNDNFIFKKNTSYSFEIGIGGKCDINNVNKLFQSGLSLKIYNNTTPKLTDINFSGDDYSSLGITSAEIIQSYITDNITIPSTIFNNNTTYIWDGYIKSKNNFVKISVNSKIKVIIWVDKKVYDNTSAIVDGINVNDIKVIELDTNKYFNIKIIAYNFDTAKTNFNIKFEDCDLFNFNKNGEIYNYTQATDTNIIYKTEDEKSFIIKSKGGGNGGCGFYNQNQNLDGGCGGGSGINKKNGKAIVDASFNGNDGAIGTYCGGGGGILSPGNDNKGGKGKIIEWFNKDVIFGAGGNGAPLKENRELGYGSGGDGGDCCQLSKLAINNDGNNGCILIYFQNNDIIETFANTKINTGKDTTYYNDNSIVNRLIINSFTIYNDSSSKIKGTLNRQQYFDNIGQEFAKLCYDDDKQTGIPPTILKSSTAVPISILGGNNNMNNFIYDMIVASKFFSVFYRLYYHHFKDTLNSDITDFNKFASNANIYLRTDGHSSNTMIDDTSNVYINGLFEIANLKLDSTNTDYKVNTYCDSSTLKMSSDIYETAKTDIGSIQVPLYHNISGTIIPGLSNWYNDNMKNSNKKFVNKINPISASQTTSVIKNNNCGDDTSNKDKGATIGLETCISSPDVNIPFIDSSVSYLNKARLQTIYDTFKDNPDHQNISSDKYEIQRIYFHLENFNIILNTNPNILLNNLKYYMYYYNAIVYNVILQYDLFKMQQLRITNFYGEIKSTAAASIGGSLTHTLYNSREMDNGAINGYLLETNAVLNAKITSYKNDITNFKNNLENIYTSNINNENKYLKMSSTIQKNTDNINNITTEFDKYQMKYNKVVYAYNTDLDSYKNINKYYNAVIIISIIIVIVSIFLFSIPQINSTAQTGVFLIIAILMILFYVFYLANLKITETFINCRYKSLATVNNQYNDDLDYYDYKIKSQYYLTFITLLANGITTADDTITPMSNFIGKANDMRKRKILFYKSKIVNYTNASEVLKKEADNYYYLMTLIYFTIIITLITMALYILFPILSFMIIIFAIIIFLILLIYIIYKINRSTRLLNDKNYWANFNPSSEVIQSL
jgi:hypothetical protein